MRLTFEHRGAVLVRDFDDDEELSLKEAVLAVEMGDIATVRKRLDLAENLERERENHATRNGT